MTEGFPSIDFDAYHRSELPPLLASGRGVDAAASAMRFGPLAFSVSGKGAFSYVPREGGLDVVAGHESAETVVELDDESWQGLVHELESLPGLLYGGRAKCRRGNPMRLIAWEPALRAIYNGRPIFDPACVRLVDLAGAPLDVEASFEIADDREEMAHFLRTAGFLHVRGVFSAEEIATFKACALELRDEARKGDRDSWWGRNSSGNEVLCRVTRAASKPDLAALNSDPRITGMVALADGALERCGEVSDSSVTVIYKLPDMVEGLSNIPWHRDCGLGGHAVLCPILIVSIFLGPATPETGELRVLPGSWQASCPAIDVNDPLAPTGVSLSTQAGDVSLHYGDLMHAAPTPTRSDLAEYRTSVVMAFGPRGSTHHRGERGYNDVLLSRDDGQVEHLADLTKKR
jgi:hypothetical protein